MDRLDCDRMFVAVMDTGSFAAAAQRLGTSSGQASKLVARLEQDLGVRLLNRTTRALKATEVGQAYYERCRQIMLDFAEAEQAVMQLQQSRSGLLRITAPIEFGQLFLGRVLGEFMRQ